MAKVVVIGSGFSGLASACYLAKAGHEVTVLEKNTSAGGRARAFEVNGFVFDMGPSWYWMPDIFEKFFNDFGKQTSDYYDLKKLDPGFKVFFGNKDTLSVPADRYALYSLFESIEKGSAEKLKTFLNEGEFKYRVGMQELAYKPALSWLEFANLKVLKGVARTHMFRSVKSYVRSFFKDPRLVALMEFPVLFLGAKPDNIPALYSLMNYAALEMGTYYPMGGMSKIVEGMISLAESLGVKIETSCEVKEIKVKNGISYGVNTSNGFYMSDTIIATADYHHVEQKLLRAEERNYTPDYWDKKIFAPSCLIFYLGLDKKIEKLDHHNLFFDRDFDKHATEIYDKPKWPEEPLFYTCCPSKTDSSVAPAGKENLFLLIPIAPGLEDNEELRQNYYNRIMQRLEIECNENINQYVIYKESYCIKDFIKDYNAYKGNAYGLANTLNQTAVLKPRAKSNHVANLFYAGQLTVPGPGVPPALISGKISAQLAINHLKTIKHETVV